MWVQSVVAGVEVSFEASGLSVAAFSSASLSSLLLSTLRDSRPSFLLLRDLYSLLYVRNSLLSLLALTKSHPISNSRCWAGLASDSSLWHSARSAVEVAAVVPAEARRTVF